MRNLLVLTVTCFLLQGCLEKKNDLKEDVVFLQSVPVCNTPDMCNKMWQAATDWVSKYSPQGIDTLEDDIIISEDKEIGSDEMEIVIKKIKLDDTSYKILIDNVCTSSFSPCAAERNNMLAFNKKLIGFMSAKEQVKKEKAFDANAGLNTWLKNYSEAYNQYSTATVAPLLHFPVTLIEQSETKVLSSLADLEAYLTAQKSKMRRMNGEYIKLESMKVNTRTGRNLFVTVNFNIYDKENVVVKTKKTGLHLIEVDKQLKMISLDTSD